MGTLSYVRGFMTDKYIASITPTSEWGVRRVCAKIDPLRTKVIVEYGPGTGVFSRHLLRVVAPDAALLLIERNGRFVERLRAEFRDPRVHLADGCASRAPEILVSLGLRAADCVLSGIPFSFLSDGERERILRTTHDLIRPGGKFLAYQTFYQANHHLKAHLERIFGNVRVEYEMRNLPPLRIYESVRR